MQALIKRRKQNLMNEWDIPPGGFGLSETEHKAILFERLELLKQCIELTKENAKLQALLREAQDALISQPSPSPNPKT